MLSLHRAQIGIVHTRWNPEVVNALVDGAVEQMVRLNPARASQPCVRASARPAPRGAGTQVLRKVAVRARYTYVHSGPRPPPDYGALGGS